MFLRRIHVGDALRGASQRLDVVQGFNGIEESSLASVDPEDTSRPRAFIRLLMWTKALRSFIAPPLLS